MIKSSIERVARTRYVMPVVLALAVVAVVVIVQFLIVFLTPLFDELMVNTLL